MEERVGELWHRLITRASRRGYPEAAVQLTELRPILGIFFRALGGDPGLALRAGTPTEHGARQGFLERVAGNNRKVELAWLDAVSLQLPQCLACFPTPSLNRDLYLWLVALAAQPADSERGWLARSQAHTLSVLAHYPGLRARYRRLVDAHLAERPDPDTLPSDEAAAERALRQALQRPGSLEVLPPARRPPAPNLLWLHPSPPLVTPDPVNGDDPEQSGSASDTRQDDRRRRAERVQAPTPERGLLAFRLESLFSWAEHTRVDRSCDDDADPDARQVADDLDRLSVARDRRPVASRLRFDLDLPSADHDDTPLSGDHLFPEWDYRRRALMPNRCRLQTLVALDAPPVGLPARLRRPAARIRSQLESLTPSRVWLRRQPQGQEPDLDAWLAFAAERNSGRVRADPGLYCDARNGARDLACLLLADLSLSTDAHVNDSARVIDVVRDSLFLFSEGLNGVGDRYAIYGFSSRRREHVRLNLIKAFGEGYGARVRGRIAALRPGYYTRMGAPIRRATQLLQSQPASQRLLLLLSDGKPNDLDHYEGRYGVEDTRMALLEARRQGVRTFCVTIDREAGSYLPYLFGSGGYLLLRRPEDLPRRLPLLYAQMTR
jgi:nitric oxide reductase NorD protein